MWYMHDGAPAHFIRAVRDVLNNTYHDRWIGRAGPTAWPPLPPYLISLDFHMWGNLNTLRIQLLLTTERHFTTALRVPVRLSETTPTSLNG
jgi:hypothetical protein